MSAMGRGCLDEAEILDFFAGCLRGPVREAIERHIDVCPSCLDLVASVAAGIAGSTPDKALCLPSTHASSLTKTAMQGAHLWPEASSDDRVILRRGMLIGGRYEIRRLIGVGGMGVIYSSLDRSLDREVALKALRYQPSTREEAIRAEDRLLREAQILAGLSHPNIVVAFDVGSDEGLVFITMELVHGRTLGAWLQASPPPSQEAILEVFIAAGRGVAAAHAAGVIHRDLKPANILVGDDGRVRVTDFGLALNEAKTIDKITDHGPGRVGTPRYMSPEQLSGAPASAASDQFGFTLALAEGLLGSDPFSVSSLKERRSAIAAGPVLDGHTQSLSRPLRCLLRQGLAERPSDRYPSMAALCDELERIRHRQPWRLWGTLGLLSAAVVTVVALRGVATVTCEDSQRLAAGVWNPAKRAQIEVWVEGSQDPRAAQAWRQLEPSFDHFANHWTRAYNDACTTASDDRGAHRQRALAQMACLERVLPYLDASILLSEKGDIDTFAALAKWQLSSQLSRCEGETTPIVPFPKNRAEQAKVLALRIRLNDAWRLAEEGDIEGLDRLVKAAEIDAETLGFMPIFAQVLLFRARVEHLRGDHEGAVATLERALAIAEESAYDTLIPMLWLELALVDIGRGRLDRAERALRRADACGVRGSVSAELRTHELLTRAYLLRMFGRHREAIEVHRELRERVVDEVELARVLVAESLSRSALGEWQQALRLQQQALVLRQQALREGHSRIAGVHNLLGETLLALGRMQEAEEHLQRALEIRERLGRGADLERTRVLLNIGRLAQALGDPARALRVDLEVLEIREERLGHGHPEVAEALMAVGEIHRAQGDAAAAMPLQRRAQQLLDRTYGPDHPHTALALIAYAEACLATKGGVGALDLAELDRALEVLEAAEIRPEERAHARSVVARAS
ncbi:MAG TPA: tetratricopeptide repeat protein, partial [Nannocystis exedens]|nr:tetratricopeptide repeat protein [Nannocystis exedens]